MKGFINLLWLIGVAYHIWTVVIAFQHSFIAGVVSLFLPVLSEIYWIFKMFGENNVYSICGIISFFIASILASIVFKK